MGEHVYDSKMASFVALVHPIQSITKHLTLMLDNKLHVSNRSYFVVTNTIPSEPLITRVTQRLFSWFARSFGRPPLCLSISPPTSFLKCTIEDWFMPTKAATLRV